MGRMEVPRTQTTRGIFDRRKNEMPVEVLSKNSIHPGLTSGRPNCNCVHRTCVKCFGDRGLRTAVLDDP